MRFSRFIPWALAFLVLAGLILVVVQVDSVQSLWSTSYGRVLDAKLLIFAGLLALAACNRNRLTPHVVAGAAGSGRALSRVIALEIMLVAAILGLTASWRFTPPPRSLSVAAIPTFNMHLHSPLAMANVALAPGRVGPVKVTILMLTPRFEPMDAKEVEFVLRSESPGIEPIRRPARKQGGNAWRIDDMTIPAPGRWRVQLEVLVDDFEKARLEALIEIKG